MGKTGLVQHVFHKLESKKHIQCIYADIYATQNLKDFTNQLNSAVLRAFAEKKNIGKRFMDWIKGFKPVISFDSLTGQPEVSFDYTTPRQYEQSLESLFHFLDEQEVKVIIGIDEFQQITEYPEKNTEALLRTIIQQLKNVHFIFSGSRSHILNEMFNNSKRPFFASTQLLHLAPIEEEVYKNYIKEHFARHKRIIHEEALVFIIDWSRGHTYYTQALCNRLFAKGIQEIRLAEVRDSCHELLKENETSYFTYRNLLTHMQWQLLKAIAKEEKVHKPTSRQFLHDHDVGTAANVQKAMEALQAKEMVYAAEDQKGRFYQVYDCFLSRWLEGLD